MPEEKTKNVTQVIIIIIISVITTMTVMMITNEKFISVIFPLLKNNI